MSTTPDADAKDLPCPIMIERKANVKKPQLQIVPPVRSLGVGEQFTIWRMHLVMRWRNYTMFQLLL